MIAHVDADSFFASVLVRQNPRLEGKPLLALGMGGGCVIAASYEAKAKGVKTGMPLKEAMRLVPEAIKVNSDFQEAGLASEQIEEIIRTRCPVVEQMSIDEWYLDLATVIGGVPADPGEWAKRLQSTIRELTGLWVSAGVGPSKLLAKMAGEYRKPRGITVVTDDRPGTLMLPQNSVTIGLRTMLQDRPAAAIPGIGRRRGIHTEIHGWHSAWDIAMAPADELKRLFGRPGEDLKRELLGERLSEVRSEVASPKSVSRARSFRRETDPRVLWAHLLRHAEYTVLKMRRHGLACRGVSVWLRDDQYNYQSAHTSLPQLTSTEEALQPYVRRCVRQLHRKRTGYTQVGLALWRLEPQGAMQYSLFEGTERMCRSEDVQRTLDVIHKRFGRNAITRGSALSVKTGTRRGFMVPTYEE
jgi:DNA polymerase IV